MTKNKQITETFRCVREGTKWGQWITEGRTYQTTRRADGKGDVWFMGEQGSTYMPVWQFRRAIAQGWIVQVEG